MYQDSVRQPALPSAKLVSAFLDRPVLDRHAERVSIPEKIIRRAARERAAGGSLPWAILRQAYHESRVWLVKRIDFRRRENDHACHAYCAMTAREFEGINARQRWANWRTIPRNLDGRLPNRPVRALDLCCGVGHSTEVLAYYLAPGSEILGLEYNPAFVKLARRRTYLDDRARPRRVHFRAQSVLETLCDDAGEPLRDASVDLVNSSGAVGCHFDGAATRTLAAEVARVLKPSGLALMDSGPAGTDTPELIEIFSAAGFSMIGSAKSCPVDRYTQVCFRRLPSTFS